MKPAPLVRFLVLSLLATGVATGAGWGSLRLRVVDADGNPIAGAAVRVTHKDTWHKDERASGDDGRAYYHRLQVGEFRVRVEARGFELRSDSRDCLVIIGSRTLEHTIVLHPLGVRGRPAELACPRLVADSDGAIVLEPLLNDVARLP